MAGGTGCHRMGREALGYWAALVDLARLSSNRSTGQ